MPVTIPWNRRTPEQKHDAAVLVLQLRATGATYKAAAAAADLTVQTARMIAARDRLRRHQLARENMQPCPHCGGKGRVPMTPEPEGVPV
jgi:hypothetical protein